MPRIARELVGMTFGRLTVIERSGKNKHGAAMWRCACSCGGEHIAAGSLLLNGNVRSCGCLRADAMRLRKPPIKDLAGKVFGRLTAVRHVSTNKHGQAVWLCQCSCGNAHEVVSQSLVLGHTTSCGCLRHDTPAHNRVHNMSRTPLFGVWAMMLSRCGNQNAKAYKDYGGRGIKVCDRWQFFENFHAAMGDRPTPKHQIDRIDNEGPYSPENCRWALREQQAKNKRNTRLLTANGETLHLAEWARRLGCNPAAILARLATGMPETEAVTKPIPARPNSRLTPAEAIEIRSTYPSLSAQKLADLYGVSKKTILNVIHGKTFADLH